MRKFTDLFTRNIMTAFMTAAIVPLLLLTAIMFVRSNSSLGEHSAQAEAALRSEVERTLVAQNLTKKEALEQYVGQIENQVTSFSQLPMIAEAVQQFSESSRKYAREIGVDDTELREYRAGLRSFYMNEFDRLYREKNGKPSQAASYLSQISDQAALMQHEYIQNNPNPTGSKEALDRAAAGTRYNAFHEKYHPSIRNYLEKFGYYDIFLVDHKTGDIVYSVFKELDFMTSLISGPYSNTNFAEVFREAAAASSPGSFALADLALYGPSYDAAAGFIASPIFDGSEKVGVLVFQLPVDRIADVMRKTGGLGEGGDAYVVGSDHLMRSISYLDSENYSVTGSFSNPGERNAKSEFVKLALAGESGIAAGAGLRDREVLAAYAPFEFGETRWAVVSEVDPAEAFDVLNALNERKSAANMSLILWSLGVLVASTVAIILFVRSLVSPLNGVLASIERAASGDLTNPVFIDRKDEIGQMANKFAEFISKLRDQIMSIKDQGEELTTSSTDLRAVAGKISAEISEINNQSNAVASTTDEMTANISTVAAAIEESSTNVQNVAAAVEEMSQNLSNVSENVEGMAGNVNTVASAVESMSESLGEVAGSSNQAAEIATRAADAAKQTNDTVSRLGDSAQEIGKVVGVINDIAEQTNLLALNATIEAASAGEAGRGFAVVANEVKELAKQTASATDEIREKISDMQDTTRGSVSAIQEIVGIIDEINSISQEIAVSVGSQRTSAADIAQEVAAAAKAAMVVNENVRECSQSASEIAKNGEELSSGANEISRSAAEASSGASQTSTSIQQVSDSVRSCAEGASNTDDAAQKMAGLATRLHELVEQFSV